MKDQSGALKLFHFTSIFSQLSWLDQGSIGSSTKVSREEKNEGNSFPSDVYWDHGVQKQRPFVPPPFAKEKKE